MKKSSGTFCCFVWVMLSGACATVDNRKVSNDSDASSLGAVQAIEKGDRAVTDGNTDSALNYYVQALTKDPKSDATLLKVAAIHESRGNMDLAMDAYKMAVAAAPNNVLAMEKLGLMQFERHQYPEAAKNLNRVATLDPQRWQTFNALGLMADRELNYTTALEHYTKAIAINPNSAMLLNNLGYSKYLAGDFDGAKEQFGKALKVDPKYDRALLNLGLLLARTGHEDDAFNTFKSIMDEAAAYNNLGFVQMLNGNYPEAEEYFQRSISLSPTYNEQANNNMARLRELWRQDVDSGKAVKVRRAK